MHNPVPTKSDSMKRLINNVPVSCIVDVGVQECTNELLKIFPDKKHYLVEPVHSYFAKIEENYKELDYMILPYALSDKEYEAYLVISSMHRNGIMTHSHIRSEPYIVDGKHIIESLKIKVRRFDQLEICQMISDNFLLKIDVDGQDINVAIGFGEIIRKTSVIIIETSSKKLLDKIEFFNKHEFILFDIVDLIYYGLSLYQFDLVFVRNDLVTNNIIPPIKIFNKELWKPLRSFI